MYVDIHIYVTYIRFKRMTRITDINNWRNDMPFTRDPQKRKDNVSRPENSPTVATRLNVKGLATVLKFLQSKGVRVHTQSELARYGFEMGKDAVINTGLVDPVVDLQEAYSVLEQAGITWNRGSRGEMVMKELSRELRIKDKEYNVKQAGLTEEDYQGYVEVMRSRGETPMSFEELDRRMREDDSGVRKKEVTPDEADPEGFEEVEQYFDDTKEGEDRGVENPYISDPENFDEEAFRRKEQRKKQEMLDQIKKGKGG